MTNPALRIVDTVGGQNVLFHGKLLYPDQPEASATARCCSVLVEPQTLYLVYSPLLFHGIGTLAEKLPESSSLLFIEADEDLYRLSRPLYEDFLTAYDDSSGFLFGGGNSDGILKEIHKTVNSGFFRKTVPVYSNLGYRLNSSSYREITQSTQDLIQQFWKNRMTVLKMGRLWCSNIFKNINLLPVSRSLNDLSTGKPVFIAGAGESLEDSIPHIVKYRDDFFLIAVDTALPALLEQGVKPDLAVVLEAQHYNLSDFYTEGALDIPAAFDLTSSPELLRKHRGPKYFFISEFYSGTLLKTFSEAEVLPTMIPPLGSVGMAAVYIALCITKAVVCYSGLDLSYIPEKYHAKSCPSHKSLLISCRRTASAGFFGQTYSSHRFPRTDKSGRRVFTDIIMLSYLERLSELGSVSGRLVDFGLKGLPSANPGFDAASFKALPENDPPVDTGRVVFVLNSTAGVAAGDVEAFLEKQIGLLDEAVNAVKAFLNGVYEYGEERLIETLKPLDYCYLFFPDNRRLPCTENSFLKRFLFSAAFFRRLINRTLDSCGSD